MKTILFTVAVALAFTGATAKAQYPPSDRTHVSTPFVDVDAPAGSSVNINHGGYAPAGAWPTTVAYHPGRFFFRPRLRRAYWIGAGRPGATGYPAGPRVRVNVN